MRPSVISSVPVCSLLLLGGLHSASRATAQGISCVVTYDCHGNSQCAQALGGLITKRTVTDYKSQTACDAAAKTVLNGTTASCNCNAGAGGSVMAMPAAPAAPGHEMDGVIKQAITAGITHQISAGSAVGFVGLGLLGNALFGAANSAPAAPPPEDPAEVQRKIAAQQLNNSGVYLLKQHDYIGAINEFRQALANEPGDGSIQHNLELAQQQQKNAAIAGENSGELGQALGSAPPGTTGSPIMLALVGANPLPPVPPAASQPSTPPDPEALKGQIDGVLNGNPPSGGSDVPSPQAQDVDQIFQQQPAAPAASPGTAQPAPEAAAQSATPQQQVDDLFKSPDTTADSAALAQQAKLGQQAAAASSDEGASNLAKQGFDTAAPSTPVSAPTAVPAAAQIEAVLVKPSATAPSAYVSDSSLAGHPLAAPVPRSVPQPQQVAVNSAPPLIGASITVLRTSGSTDFAAPGKPIFDCAGDRVIVARLTAALPAQKDAIRRTEAILSQAKGEKVPDTTDIATDALKTMVSTATTYANWAEASIALLDGPRAVGLIPDSVARFRYLQDLKENLELANHLIEVATFKDDVFNSYNAGKDFGNAMIVKKTATELVEKVTETARLLDKTGVGEEAASKLALVAGGPIAEALVKAIFNSMDLYVDVEENLDNANLVQQADHDLTNMRDQLLQVNGRIYEIQQELVADCSSKN